MTKSKSIVGCSKGEYFGFYNHESKKVYPRVFSSESERENDDGGCTEMHPSKEVINRSIIAEFFNTYNDRNGSVFRFDVLLDPVTLMVIYNFDGENYYEASSKSNKDTHYHYLSYDQRMKYQACKYYGHDVDYSEYRDDYPGE